MRAPTPLALQALRSLAFRSFAVHEKPPHLSSHCRPYASHQRPPPPSPRRPESAPQPPTRNSKSAPPPPSTNTAPLSKQKSAPILAPLTQPLGFLEPPVPLTQRPERDTRSWRQKRDDFHNYTNHLSRRAALTQKLSTPYFRDWTAMRHHEGKTFVAPTRVFRRDFAGYWPEMWGWRLRGGWGSVWGGMRGRVNVVCWGGNEWADRQTRTWVEENAGVGEVMREFGEGVVQRAWVSVEGNWMKWLILRFLGARQLRRGLKGGEAGRWSLVKGVGEEVMGALGMGNRKAGYVYLVDGEGRIRWAGSAVAGEKEKGWMVASLRRLCLEAKGEVKAGEEVEGEKLEEAVGEVIEEKVQTA